jgi:hypothetical protein
VESKLGPLDTSASNWPIVPAPGDCEDGEFGGGNRSTRRKPAPAPLCSPQIPLDQTRARTRAFAVGSQRLTAWAMARPGSKNKPSKRPAWSRGPAELCFQRTTRRYVARFPLFFSFGLFLNKMHRTYLLPQDKQEFIRIPISTLCWINNTNAENDDDNGYHSIHNNNNIIIIITATTRSISRAVLNIQSFQ